MPTATAIIGIGRLVDAHTTTAVLTTRAVTRAATGTRPFYAGFP